MSIFFKNFGPYSKLRIANWPIAWRKQTQPYNKLVYRLNINIVIQYHVKKKRLNVSLIQLLKFFSGKSWYRHFHLQQDIEAPNDNCNHYIFFANVRDPELYFDLTSQITLLVLHQADCGVFVLGILLFFFTSHSFTNNLSLGDFQSVCLFVKDNTATLEQEWPSSIFS